MYATWNKSAKHRNAAADRVPCEECGRRGRMRMVRLSTRMTPKLTEETRRLCKVCRPIFGFRVKDFGRTIDGSAVGLMSRVKVGQTS